MIPGLVADTPPIMGGQLRVRRVLVVDEATPVRRNVAEILHRSGLAPQQVRTAASADEALEAFRRERPTLVFTELVGRDSEEGLAMVLGMLDADPTAKIVLLTAEDPNGPLVRHAVRAGVFAVVSKPLRQEKIRHLLSEVEAEEGGIERFR